METENGKGVKKEMQQKNVLTQLPRALALWNQRLDHT